MPSFSVKVDQTSTSAVELVSAATAAGKVVRVGGFILTVAGDVEIRLRDTDATVLLPLLLSKGVVGAFPNDLVLRTGVGKGLQIKTESSVRITGLVWGSVE